MPKVQAAAQEGDTAPPALEDVVDLHFVALVNKNSRLVELDGRKSFPIDHGKTTDSTLLQVNSLTRQDNECQQVCGFDPFWRVGTACMSDVQCWLC